jgi:hypothetical protein
MLKLRQRLKSFSASKLLTPKRVFTTTIVVDLALIAAALIIFLSPREATFTVDARTEAVAITIVGGERPPYWLLLGELKQESSPTCSNARLEAPSLLAGDLVVNLESLADDFMAGDIVGLAAAGFSLMCADGAEIPINEPVNMSWKSAERAITLPFTGSLVIGRLPSDSVLDSRLLLAGNVSVETSSRPITSGFVRSETSLSKGDEVRILASPRGIGEAISAGVVRSSSDGLEVTARARADHVEIIRLGLNRGATVSVAPSGWDKLRAQSEWAILIFCGAVLLNLLAAAQTYANRPLASRSAQITGGQ